MLLKEVKATNSAGEELTLNLEDPSNGLIVKSINGLGPTKATLVSSSFANMDGEQFYSSRRDKRNIVIQLGLDPDYGSYSAFDLRNQLYKFFMPKTEVDLEFTMFDRFQTDFLKQTWLPHIMGRIESLEPAIFTSEPAVDISIVCFDPDFCDQSSMIFEGDTTDSLTETTLTYNGTVETGVLFKLFANRSIDDLTIFHRTPDNVLRTFYVDHTIEDTDELHVNSLYGDKYVNLLVGGSVTESILYAVAAQSSWVELFKGDNNFRVYTDGAPIPYTIEYIEKYGGL